MCNLLAPPLTMALDYEVRLNWILHRLPNLLLLCRAPHVVVHHTSSLPLRNLEMLLEFSHCVTHWLCLELAATSHDCHVTLGNLLNPTVPRFLPWWDWMLKFLRQCLARVKCGFAGEPYCSVWNVQVDVGSVYFCYFSAFSTDLLLPPSAFTC